MRTLTEQEMREIAARVPVPGGYRVEVAPAEGGDPCTCFLVSASEPNQSAPWVDADGGGVCHCTHFTEAARWMIAMHDAVQEARR